MARIRSLDLARGFTVLMMAPVHTVLLYSDPVIYHTLLVKMLSFIAEGPGAQLFMMLMGIYMGLSKTLTAKKVVTKSLLIFLAGYGLNVIKFVIPYGLGMLPEPILHDLQITTEGNAWIQLLTIGDIFHFAAMALLITGMLRRYKGYPWLAIVSALLVLIISPFFWDGHTGYTALDDFLQLLGGQPPQVFFPVFPWLVYPLTGVTIGYFLKRNAGETFRILRDLGVVLLLIHFVYRLLFPLDEPSNFYRTEASETLEHLGIVFIALFVWYWISEYLPPNRFFKFLEYSSHHITKLYIIQWILIMWCLPVAGYHQLQLLPTIAWILLTTSITYGIAYLIIAYQEFASVTNK